MPPASSFEEARAALQRTVKRVFPNAKPTEVWSGIRGWGVARPKAIVVPRERGTFDATRIVIGIAERKAGPTIYFVDPGDYYALGTHKALLEGAGLKLGRACIMHTRKGPLPVAALEEMFRRVKARDAALAKAAGKVERPAAKKAAPRRMAGVSTVEAYLDALAPEQRAALERLRGQVHAAAPGATEKISYGIPTFVHGGRNLVHMAAFKEHCSFFPGSGGVALALREKLKGHVLAKGTIRFTPDHPIPPALVKRIVKMRLAEEAARMAGKRRARPKPAGKTRRA